MRPFSLILILVLAAVPLLADGGGAGSHTRDFSGGAVTYFAANEGEIWRTDGTPEGTGRFAVTATGQYAMLPLPWQGKVIFFGVSMTSPRRTDIYVSDGAVTRLMTSIDARWGPSDAALFRDRIYFATESADSGDKAKLWATDGTAEGTGVVAELPEGLEPILIATGTRLFISMTEDDGYRWSDALWTSDGTEAGTIRIASGLQYPLLTQVGEVVLFYGRDGRVWRSDGTAEGTYALGRGWFAAGGTAAWILDDDGRLFRSDGSKEGTVEVWSFLDPVQLVGANETGKVFLTGWGGTGAGLFALDPAARVYAWLTGVTTRGTTAVAAIGETLYFTTAHPALGAELWRSDGTEGGTGLVRDIAAGAESSYPYDFTRAGNRLLFAATDRQSGYEPWVTDGTAAGTRMLANIAPEATIDGRVTDAATGAPVAGASVRLAQTWHGSSSQNHVATVTTDAAGRYVIRNLEKETYRITVTTATHLAQSSSTFDVGSGASVRIDLALRRGAAITGRVAGADGAPVAGIPVEVGAVFGTVVIRTQTDAEGRYVAGGVPAGGPWLVWTAGDEYSQVIYEGVRCLAGCNAASWGTEIVLAEGEVRSGVDFTVAPRGRIRGKLVDAASGIEPDYSQTSHAAIYGFRVGQPVDLAHPAFVIQAAGNEFDAAVPDGTYHLLVKWPRTVRDTYQWTWYPNAPCTTCTVAEGTAVTPLQDPAAPGYVFVLTPTHGYVTGRIVDAVTGAPLEEIHVYLTRSPAEYAGGTTTGADGTFHVPAPAGTYSVRVGGSDTHAPIGLAGTVAVRDGAVSAMGDLLLHRRPDVEVRVIDAVTQQHLFTNFYPGEPGERELAIRPTGWRPVFMTVAVSYDDNVKLVVPLQPACDVTVAAPPLLPADGGTIALRVDASCAVCPSVRGLPYQNDYIRCIPAGGGELRFTLARNPSAEARTGTLILPGVAIPLTQEGFRSKSRAVRH